MQPRILAIAAPQRMPCDEDTPFSGGINFPERFQFRDVGIERPQNSGSCDVKAFVVFIICPIRMHTRFVVVRTIISANVKVAGPFIKSSICTTNCQEKDLSLLATIGNQAMSNVRFRNIGCIDRPSVAICSGICGCQFGSGNVFSVILPKNFSEGDSVV